MKLAAVAVMMFVGSVGLLGLLVASRAVDSGMHFFGVILFAFAVAFNFWAIKYHFDSAEQAERARKAIHTAHNG